MIVAKIGHKKSGTAATIPLESFFNSNYSISNFSLSCSPLVVLNWTK